MALALGLLLLIAFVRHEMKAQDPILPVHIFVENREFSLSNLTAMVNYSATFAISFLMSIYLQSVLGLSSREAGLVMLIQPIVMAMLSPTAGKLSDHHSPTRIATVGMAITALGILGLVAVVHLESLWLVVPVVIVIGIGFALFAAPNNNAIMGAVPKRYYSLATSMIGTVRLVGGHRDDGLVTGLEPAASARGARAQHRDLVHRLHASLPHRHPAVRRAWDRAIKMTPPSLSEGGAIFCAFRLSKRRVRRRSCAGSLAHRRKS